MFALLVDGSSVLTQTIRLVTPVSELEKAVELYNPDRLYISATIVQNPDRFINQLLEIEKICSTKIPTFIGGQGITSQTLSKTKHLKYLENFEQVYNS